MLTKTTITIEIDDEEGDTTTHELPAKFDLCQRCKGAGSHTNPSIDGHGITSDEWERDWDDESREAYFAGRYDVTCEVCKGLRVVQAIDVARLTPAQRLVMEEHQERQEERARWDAEDRQTRRMESGGWG